MSSVAHFYPSEGHKYCIPNISHHNFSFQLILTDEVLNIPVHLIKDLSNSTVEITITQIFRCSKKKKINKWWVYIHFVFNSPKL